MFSDDDDFISDYEQPILCSSDDDKQPSPLQSDDDVDDYRPIAKLPRNSKTLESQQQDRISDLPDSILLYILALIPITHAIRTTLISKRWDNLWSSLPSLVFDYKDHTHETDFLYFVDRALILSNSHVIRKFSLVFGFPERITKYIDSWMRFAVNHKVEELDLFFHETLIVPPYEIPLFLYTYYGLIKLSLRQCSFGSCWRINWRSLRQLSFSICSVDEVFMEKLWVGCPVLESLELHNTDGWKKLNVSCVSLKELVIDGYGFGREEDEDQDEDEDEEEDANSITICAPHLQLLVITGWISQIQFRIENVSSLVEARLDFRWDNLEDCQWLKELKIMVRELVGRMKHVKKLHLGEYFFQVISLHYSNPFTYPLICTNLVLEAKLEEGGLRGLANMLQSCPLLEILVIHLQSFTTGLTVFERPMTMKTFSRLQHNGLRCMQHLKMVKVFGLIPGHCQTQLVIEFLQFILKYAMVLEKLSINTSQCSRNTCATEGRLFLLVRSLLKFPRSSPFAEIHLN